MRFMPASRSLRIQSWPASRCSSAGSPEGRGVVAAASYAARAFGVRSAMPMSRALVLCPEAVILPSRFSLYGDYSQRVMGILRQATPLFEQMSIDEAYLDVTEQVPAWEAAVELARQLQHQVREEVGLSASLGVWQPTS